MYDVSNSIDSLMVECNRYHAQMAMSAILMPKNSAVVVMGDENMNMFFCCATKT
jgi:hypothetical protein